jgi:hypothetical protein
MRAIGAGTHATTEVAAAVRSDVGIELGVGVLAAEAPRHGRTVLLAMSLVAVRAPPSVGRWFLREDALRSLASFVERVLAPLGDAVEVKQSVALLTVPDRLAPSDVIHADHALVRIVEQTREQLLGQVSHLAVGCDASVGVGVVVVMVFLLLVPASSRLLTSFVASLSALVAVAAVLSLVAAGGCCVSSWLSPPLASSPGVTSCHRCACASIAGASVDLV